MRWVREYSMSRRSSGLRPRDCRSKGLWRNGRTLPVPASFLSLNNIVEQDHRFIKKRIAASLWFRSVKGAVNTIAGYESMHMIKKGQVRWLAKDDIAGQVRFIHQIFGIVA